MEREDLDQIIVKYRNLSNKFAMSDDNKSHLYERFAEWVEDNIDESECLIERDESSDYEKDIWDHFIEVEEEYDNYWDEMFPEGDEDDSITDWMTKD